MANCNECSKSIISGKIVCGECASALKDITIVRRLEAETRNTKMKLDKMMGICEVDRHGNPIVNQITDYDGMKNFFDEHGIVYSKTKWVYDNTCEFTINLLDEHERTINIFSFKANGSLRKE